MRKFALPMFGLIILAAATPVHAQGSGGYEPGCPGAETVNVSAPPPRETLMDVNVVRSNDSAGTTPPKSTDITPTFEEKRRSIASAWSV